MVIDNTIAEIIVEIQKRTKEKYNIDVEFEQVAEIINIQITATVFGFARNTSIYWRGFLKFIWTDRRNRLKDNKVMFDKILDENNNLTDKEKDYYHYLARVAAFSAHKDLVKLANTSKSLTASELKAIPTKSPQFLNFKPLLRKKKT